MLLKVNGIEKQYNSEVLFSDISFTVDEKQKIAFVGKNGVGKSTILKIIADIKKPDSGLIEVSKGKKVSYLPQDIEEDVSGIEYIQNSKDGPFMDHVLYPILNGFSLNEDLINRKVNTLSGGQKTKILLARFMLERSDILLLDEPTNNLDVPSLIFLEELLAQSKKAMIIVSHDLFFLNRICNKVFELKNETLNIEGGTYGDYMERKQKEFERQKISYKTQQEKIQQIQKNIKTLQDKGDDIENFEVTDNAKKESDYKKGKATAGQRRTKVFKTKLSKIEKIEKPYDEGSLEIEINPKNISGDLRVEFEDVVSGYSKKEEFPTFSFELKFGKKMCLLGENGVGKSTILKTILGLQKEISGKRLIADGVFFGDLMQQHEKADRSLTPLELFQKETKKDKETGVYMLKKIGLKEEAINQKIKNLSSGTRARLLFAIFSAQGVNFLILDEPTNHLDMEVVQSLKDMLSKYKGAVILVSHNRWFLKDLHIDNFYLVTKESVNRIKDFDTYISDNKEKAKKLVQKLKKIIQM